MIAYWLMPAVPMRDFFATLLAELAQRFDAPLFEPHLTIYVENASQDRATRVIGEVAADFGQVGMSVAGVRFSEEFFKTVFVQFFPSAALTRLSEAVQSRSVDAGGYDLDPHLSLIYKTIPASGKNKLAGSLRLPFDEVIFDSVAAISVPSEAQTPAGVEAWEKVAERRLKTAGL
jgi:Cyclic phosphodiesterase-like protein